MRRCLALLPPAPRQHQCQPSNPSPRLRGPGPTARPARGPSGRWAEDRLPCAILPAGRRPPSAPKETPGTVPGEPQGGAPRLPSAAPPAASAPAAAPALHPHSPAPRPMPTAVADELGEGRCTGPSGKHMGCATLLEGREVHNLNYELWLPTGEEKHSQII